MTGVDLGLKNHCFGLHRALRSDSTPAVTGLTHVGGDEPRSTFLKARQDTGVAADAIKITTTNPQRTRDNRRFCGKLWPTLFAPDTFFDEPSNQLPVAAVAKVSTWAGPHFKTKAGCPCQSTRR
jgi:hypothetical protein